ncbi:hypothetical protein DFH06DRAFT_1468543 [Mycena polygramma]|nr:hypothetical protein DFH06DRAFT_1468543 [Mycena polygramma]
MSTTLGPFYTTHDIVQSPDLGSRGSAFVVHLMYPAAVLEYLIALISWATLPHVLLLVIFHNAKPLRESVVISRGVVVPSIDHPLSPCRSPPESQAMSPLHLNLLLPCYVYTATLLPHVVV